MDSLLSLNQTALTVASEAFSLASLLESGIHCTQQGRYIEGVAFLEFARQRLSPDQTQFAAALDTFIQSHTNRWQVQQDLFMASKRFVEAETEHQAQLLALEKLLSTLQEDTNRASQLQTVARPCLNTQGYQTPESARLLSPDSDGEQLLVLPRSSSNDSKPLPALHITCFGRFEVRQLGKPITLCSSRNGQSILRYLVTRPGHCATSDTLQTMFWPEDEPEVAQRKLHIAISALRRSLNDSSPCETNYIVCKQGVYSLNPGNVMQTDVDEFLHYYRTGQQREEEKVTFYEKACRLYSGPFLLEDMYADWSFLQREQLNQTYLTMCRVLADHYFQFKHYEDAAQWATAILKENHCDEVAHRQLIQIYAAQGYRYQALQQYQLCERLLRQELDVQPLPETQVIVQTILTSDPTSPHNKAKT